MKDARVFGLGVLLTALMPVAAANAANTLTIDYYTIAEDDKDANALAFGTFDNEVQSSLGPNGLPVLNTAAFGCVSNCISGGGLPTDLTASGEITYWSPALNNGGLGGTSDVTFTGSDTVSLPFDVPSNFFPPNGTGADDSHGFQAAKLFGTLDVPTDELISFSIGADDMAFAYLDGQIVCDLGGVHGSTAGTCVSPFIILAGTHNLKVFFVDINNVQSGLFFDVTTEGVTTEAEPPTTSGVPEPATLSLFGVALAGLGFVRRRKAA